MSLISRYNPTELQQQLHDEANADAAQRIAYLKGKIAELENSVVNLPCFNQKGNHVLIGANSAIKVLVSRYQQELDIIQTIHTNTL